MHVSSWLLVLHLIWSSCCATLQLALECRARELVPFKSWRKVPTRLRASLGIFQLGSLCLSVLLGVCHVVESKNEDCAQYPEAEASKINPDVGGIGVLLGLFTPCGFLLLMLFFGHFKGETSGVKELCMAQLANLLYLVVNLSKSMGTLNKSELLIAYSSIDAVSASVSMSYADKEVLAARKLVITGFITQFCAFVVEGVALSHLQRVGDPPGCSRSSVTHPIFKLEPQGMMWIYLAVRIFVSLSVVPILERLIQRLDEVTQAVKLFAVFHIRSSISAKKSWSDLWTEWGQSAPFIVAFVTILHVIYTFSRLFGSKALEHRIEVASACGSSTQWALHRRTWGTWTPWRTLLQRHPFWKLSLRPQDELLVDRLQLIPYDERITLLTSEELDLLWEELLLGLRLNDLPGIKDCIARGAPVDRKDDHGEYLIHSAARLGDEWLLQASYLPAIPGYLLTLNPNLETPLEIAVAANKSVAVQWILKRLEPSEEASKSVGQAFKNALKGEKEDMIVSFTTFWPNWESLEVSKPPAHVPLRFAISREKLKAAAILLKQGASLNSISRPRDNTMTAFEFALRSSSDAMIEVLHPFRPDPVTLGGCIRTALERGLLSLLRDLGTDPSAMMISAVTIGDLKAMEILVSQGVSTEALDYVLTAADECKSWGPHDPQGATYHSQLWTEHLEAVFRGQGGLSGDAFLTWAKHREVSELRRFFESNPAQIGFVERIAKCKNVEWNSALHLVLQTENWVEVSGRSLELRNESISECVEVLLKHGACVTGQNMRGESPLRLSASKKIPVKIFSRLLDEVSLSEIDRKDAFGETLLHYVCDLESPTIYRQQLGILKGRGANPTIVSDKDQCTVLEMHMRLMKIELSHNKHVGDDGGYRLRKWIFMQITSFLRLWEDKYRREHQMEKRRRKKRADFHSVAASYLEEESSSSSSSSVPPPPRRQISKRISSVPQREKGAYRGLQVEFCPPDDFRWIVPPVEQETRDDGSAEEGGSEDGHLSSRAIGTATDDATARKITKLSNFAE